MEKTQAAFPCNPFESETQRVGVFQTLHALVSIPVRLSRRSEAEGRLSVKTDPSQRKSDWSRRFSIGFGGSFCLGCTNVMTLSEIPGRMAVAREMRDIPNRRRMCPDVPTVVAILVCFTSCKPQAPAPPPPEVSVALPVTKEVTEWDDFTGRLEPIKSVEVRARVSGYLNSIHFKDGQEVKSGDLLFVIDPRPYAGRGRTRPGRPPARKSPAQPRSAESPARRTVDARPDHCRRAI